MMKDCEFEEYLSDKVATVEARQMLRGARVRGAGVDLPRSGGSNSSVRVQSRKMGGCPIGARQLGSPLLRQL